TTIHSYTASQKLVDAPDKGDWRRGRAAAGNIVPSTTGAAVSVTRAVKGLKGLFDGIALRVPTISGSVSDITFLAKRHTSVAEINGAMKAAAKDPRWSGIFKTTTDEIVSSDIIGESHASIVDLKFTKVVDGDLVKVLAWYDNEMGYTHALVRHVIKAGALI
ncbi:type I glyceraldehyde-3-phosphate dehydrogenase, partial [Candidatus Azambacteria bacterium]|nr:type I glyceraldehyde-3-phosphate dehydrogenase [Candidatus Azambacteria bacterium]